MDKFVYSYSYDLTNTFQHNMIDIKQANLHENVDKIYGVKSRACAKFCWNEFLLKDVIKKISHPWIINLVHGIKGFHRIIFLL